MNKPSPKEMAEDMKEILRKSYQNTQKEGGELFDPFFLIYQFLKKKGAFRIFTQKEIDDTVEHAKNLAENRRKDEMYVQKLTSFEVNRYIDSTYKSIGKNLMVEKFLSKFSTMSQFEENFLQNITEKDYTNVEL
jgi:hypothetical protein